MFAEAYIEVCETRKDELVMLVSGDSPSWDKQSVIFMHSCSNIKVHSVMIPQPLFVHDMSGCDTVTQLNGIGTQLENGTTCIHFEI